ncbi:MAG: hypothetical protein Ct9H300mP16_13760 [Pseudomonadota bacterium]|nr:MAG: hypothetical protein Ct9H300mP16_13760 [Pseudomonadota bacterium]
MPESPVECVSWSVTCATRTAPAEPIDPPRRQRQVQSDRLRPVYDAGAGTMVEAVLYGRDELTAGDWLQGPAWLKKMKRHLYSVVLDRCTG